MKAIITGITGYIGSKLARELVNNNWEVYGIVRIGSNNKNLEDIQDKITFFELGNNQDLINFFKDIQADVVYHLATAYTHNGIESLIDTNIKLGTQILEAMKASGTKNFINTGTYWQHYNSNEYNPLDLYSASKQAFQDVIKFYTDTNTIKSITLKLFDTYGEDDNRPKLLNTLANLKDYDNLEMSAGEQMIDYVYIDDVINAYIKAYEYIDNVNNAEFAVASGKPMMLKELILLFQKITNNNVIIHWGKKPYRDREMMTLWQDYNTLPNWKPKVSLEKGFALMKR